LNSNLQSSLQRYYSIRNHRLVATVFDSNSSCTGLESGWIPPDPISWTESSRSRRTLTSTAMHNCLLIPEIVTQVCFNLFDPKTREDPWYEGIDVEYPGTLAALAVTCKVLYEPALDVLWSSLASVAPLLLTMPPDLWEARTVENQVF
jgi:hypothetical protein